MSCTAITLVSKRSTLLKHTHSQTPLKTILNNILPHNFAIALLIRSVLLLVSEFAFSSKWKYEKLAAVVRVFKNTFHVVVVQMTAKKCWNVGDLLREGEKDVSQLRTAGWENSRSYRGLLEWINSVKSRVSGGRRFSGQKNRYTRRRAVNIETFKNTHLTFTAVSLSFPYVLWPNKQQQIKYISKIR